LALLVSIAMMHLECNATKFEFYLIYISMILICYYLPQVQ
jgi:hypothetical protein